MSSYKTTIGIEVHAELKTKSKMFCSCKNDPHTGEANTHVCPVCMAHPGTLPVVNKEAVSLLMQMGTAIGGTLAEYSEFDRKNYFYPDIPKAYQISQYQFPFVTGGEIDGVAITRVHLEEDTARSQHDQGEGSLVDFNRAGVPLMELVTEPVIHSAEEAAHFAKELQLLLRSLKLSDANMEKGEMRVEANISVSKTNTFGTKVEVKNLNSFKSVSSAIDFEVKRQIELLEKGEDIIQETRGWDENKSKTFSQRVKESADDYRYFPDPDIPKFKRSEVSDFSDSRISEIMLETPTYKREKYKSLGISDDQIEIIIAVPERESFFSSVLLHGNPEKKMVKLLANYLVSDLLSTMESNAVSISAASAGNFFELIELLSTDQINSRVTKDLLFECVFESKKPLEIAEERGLIQKDNEEELLPIIDNILSENTSVVDEYLGGKEALLQFLVGQGMKATKGSANPAILAELLKKQIEGRKK